MTFKSMKMNDQIWKISALNTQYLYRTINLQLTVLIIFSKKKKVYWKFNTCMLCTNSSLLCGIILFYNT